VIRELRDPCLRDFFYQVVSPGPGAITNSTRWLWIERTLREAGETTTWLI